MLNFTVVAGNLVITPDEEREEMIKETGSSNYFDWFPNHTWDEIVDVCFAPYLCNGWMAVDPAQNGDLTSGLIITDGFSVWHDYDYMIMDLLEVTLTKGKPYTLYYVRSV